MELHRAIAQLSDIHAQVLRSEIFRGYRAVPTAISSGIAVIAALLQSTVLDAGTPTEFVVQWSGVAALAAAICAADLWVRARRSRTVATRVLPVVGQFLPSDLAIQGSEIFYNTVSEFVSNQLSLLLTELFSEEASTSGQGQFRSDLLNPAPVPAVATPLQEDGSTEPVEWEIPLTLRLSVRR